MTVSPVCFAPQGDTYTNVSPKRLGLWIEAVRLTYRAQEARTAVAWHLAARAWDALTQEHGKNEMDREIYRRLAAQCWLIVVSEESTDAE
jgi:hypothetical protein